MNKENLKNILQSVYNEFYNAEKWCESYLTKAQKLCLNGEKRRLRYESVKFHNLKNYIVTDAFDSFGIELSLEHQEATISTVTGISDFFAKSLDYCDKNYNKFHNFANELCQNNAYCYTKKLLELTHCILEQIKYYRRTIAEGNAANWDMTWLLQHQSTAESVHDTYEKLEKEGVSYPS